MRSSTITLTPRSPAGDDRRSAGFCFALVNAVGRLSVLDAPDRGAGLFPLGRRTVSGLVWRVDLGHGLVCWLDGDAHRGGGHVNLAATGMSLRLLGEQPWTLAESYLCGPALFTGSGQANEPAGLSERQVWLVTEAHADAEPWTTAWSLPGGDHRAPLAARR